MMTPRLEHEWKAFLATRGIAVPPGVFIPSGGGKPALPEALGGLRSPLAVKALGRAIVHKTDLGAVRLGVAADCLEATVAEVLEAIRRRGVEAVEGILVEEMVEPGIELLLGVHADPLFGRLVAFGAGGTRVEARGEVTFFAAPFRPWDVDSLLASMPWLTGALARTGPAALDGLRAAIHRFGGPDGLALDPRIESLEVNPFIVNRAGAFAVDARGVLSAC